MGNFRGPFIGRRVGARLAVVLVPLVILGG
jgi:hypothetical protein